MHEALEPFVRRKRFVVGDQPVYQLFNPVRGKDVHPESRRRGRGVVEGEHLPFSGSGLRSMVCGTAISWWMTRSWWNASFDELRMMWWGGSG
jgi:hypothetical protein